MGKYKKKPLAVRFWNKVDKRGDDECWPWIAYTDKDGYGCITVDKRSEKAHRVAWTLARGPIPTGFHVLHKCDTPPCCNDRHLFLGNNIDNINDRTIKGRSARGSRQAASKLTEGIIKEIRILAKTHRHKDLAVKFGVGKCAIDRIVQRRTWKHVP